jgi:hypothetical protein
VNHWVALIIGFILGTFFGGKVLALVGMKGS